MTRFAAILFLLLSLVACSKEDGANENGDVETFIRKYFNAFHEQDWIQMTEMMDSEMMKAMREKIFVFIPKESKDIEEAERDDIEEVLAKLEVESVEEAWKLSDKEVVLAVTKPEPESVEVYKNVETELGKMSIKERDGLIHVDLAVESRVGDQVFTGFTHLKIRRRDGRLKLVEVSKTDKKVRDEYWWEGIL